MTIVPENSIEYITCNVAELDYEEWDSEKTYNIGDKVSVLGDKKNYYATKEIIGTKPDPLDPKGLVTGWFSETSNKYKMLDKSIFNQTINTDLISFSFQAANIDVLNFFNIDANEIYIKINNFYDDELLYEKSFSLSTNGISLFHYLFMPTWFKDFLNINIPLFFNVIVYIEIRKTGSIAKCGKVFVGQGIDLGFSLWTGSQIRTKRFGKIEQDEYFGNYEIVKGEIVNQVTIPVVVDTKKLDYTVHILKKYAFDFCLFIVDKSGTLENINVYGILDDTSFSLRPKMSEYTLKIGSII